MVRALVYKISRRLRVILSFDRGETTERILGKKTHLDNNIACREHHPTYASLLSTLMIPFTHLVRIMLVLGIVILSLIFLVAADGVSKIVRAQ